MAPRGIPNPKPVEPINEVKLETPVVPTPEVKPNVVKEELVSVLIDKEMTDGGIRINGKLYVGTVKVPQHQAEDLLRIQEEYWETKKKLNDKNVTVRMKNDFQKEKLFLADPKENGNKRGFTRDYGLLGALEWSYCRPEFKEHLLQLRRQLHGY
jgi:hypothetical protein